MPPRGCNHRGRGKPRLHGVCNGYRTDPVPSRPVSLSAGDEALELRDIGAADLSPSQDADAFPADDRDDPEYVAAMQQREAARAIGYVDAICLGCGCLLYVPEGQRCGDVLCPKCQRTGEALAAEEDSGGGDDDGPDRPNGGAGGSENWPAYVAGLRSDTIIECIAMVDEGAPGRTWSKLLGIETDDQRDRFLAAAADEILRRTERLAA